MTDRKPLRLIDGSKALRDSEAFFSGRLPAKKIERNRDDGRRSEDRQRSRRRQPAMLGSVGRIVGEIP